MKKIFDPYDHHWRRFTRKFSPVVVILVLIEISVVVFLVGSSIKDFLKEMGKIL
jgi:hypothetical protein